MGHASQCTSGNELGTGSYHGLKCGSAKWPDAWESRGRAHVPHSVLRGQCYWTPNFSWTGPLFACKALLAMTGRLLTVRIYCLEILWSRDAVGPHILMCLLCMSRRWIPMHNGSDAHLIHCLCKGRVYHTLNKLAASPENAGNSLRDKTHSQSFASSWLQPFERTKTTRTSSTTSRVIPAKVFPQKAVFRAECHPERSHLDCCCPHKLGQSDREWPGAEATGEDFSIQRDILGARSITMCWPWKDLDDFGRQGSLDSKVELFLFL